MNPRCAGQFNVPERLHLQSGNFRFGSIARLLSKKERTLLLSARMQRSGLILANRCPLRVGNPQELLRRQRKY